MKSINEILEDLYAIEPELRKKEAELTKIVQSLLDSKPDTRFDEVFAARLRAELLEHPIQTRKPAVKTSGIPSPFFFGLPSRLVFAGAGALAVFLLVFMATFSPQSGGQLAFTPTFTTQAEGAFGSLVLSQSGVSEGAQAPFGGAEAASDAASSFMAPNMTATSERGMMMGSGGGTSSASPMIYPPQPVTQYRYIYTGEELSLDEAQGDVYKRNPGGQAGAVFSQLRNMNLGLMDLGSFSGMRLSQFELSGDGSNSYRIYVNMEEGSISVNPNYNKWRSLQEPQQLSQGDMPKDSAVIAIAEKFIEDHGINRSLYGDPVVQQDYYGEIMPLDAVREGAATPDGAVSSEDARLTMPAYYLPSTVSVTFPLLVRGEAVYDEGGQPHGLQVSVSVPDSRVHSVYNLMSQSYDVSKYDLVTDESRIIERLENGGLYSYVWEGTEVRYVDVEVGTPERILMRHYLYQNGENQELYVPALRFPITKHPEGERYYPQAVVLPLVADLLNQNPDRPVIMMDKMEAESGR